jgi:hypothetical protein
MLNGRLPLAPNLTPLKRPLTLDWAEQREFFGIATTLFRATPQRPESSPSDHRTRRNYFSHPSVAEHNERFS